MPSHCITQYAQSWVHPGEFNHRCILMRHVPRWLCLPDEVTNTQRGQTAGEVGINPAPDADTPLYRDKTNQPGVSIACNRFKKGPHTSQQRFFIIKGKKAFHGALMTNPEPQYVVEYFKKRDSPVYQEMENWPHKYKLNLPVSACFPIKWGDKNSHVLCWWGDSMRWPCESPLCIQGTLSTFLYRDPHQRGQGISHYIELFIAQHLL